MDMQVELTMWNSTKAFWGNGIHRIGGDGIERFQWATSGFAGEGTLETLYDWEKGIEWTVTYKSRYSCRLASTILNIWNH